ncbi:FixH family protein [Mucilaginibacter sp.]|uniref:FixH family protein n=1 Tax=Mucilaginibacter sp. TaxID=1882438 RepID=UPI002848E836|nr:FixH family protein [Mucilaginibacter sp.]MDR3695969.1 FixH family protein [Mucilaginibacter sp.]
MNWGKGIVLTLIAFMLFILTMCYRMFTAPVDDYDHQYYEKGLTFDKDYNQEVQVYKDHAVPVIKSDEDNIKLTFAQQVTSGKVTLGRPSDYTMDKVYDVKVNAQNEFTIPLQKVSKGHWLLVFNWESNHKKYLYQQGINLK